MEIKWFLIFVSLALLVWVEPVHALRLIEHDGFLVYFPEHEVNLARRIAAWCPAMTSFLEGQGLAVKKPVHIVLDEHLDMPEPAIEMLPHREIRLPLRAPGVLEEGYTEPDPWRYFLFQGLSLLSIYAERSGLPAGVHFLFGEIISPNTILPEWATFGICQLLYEHYALRRVTDPFAQAIFEASAVPDLDKASHHPEIWPGRYSYRIYGRPFIRWLYERFGWEKILFFLQLHGRGIIPLEIDLKARQAFGQTWSRLWQIFQAEHIPASNIHGGAAIVGYWQHPYFYWNETGVYPGILQNSHRSRYGCVDQNGWLWLSDYRRGGISKLELERQGVRHTVRLDHVWDPGPGSVAVTREGARPVLIVFGKRSSYRGLGGLEENIPVATQIDGPPDVLQLSGPVMDDRGRIAVSANSGGNWDIWLYDGAWYRITTRPSIEMDPWWVGGSLIFSSNAGGSFQIYGADMQPLTNEPVAAALPRDSTYLSLVSDGWQRTALETKKIPFISDALTASKATDKPQRSEEKNGQAYSAWKSIWTNYIVPDYYLSTDNTQVGIATKGQDVSRSYAWDAGVRYDVDDASFSWRLGYKAKEFGYRATRYPFSFTTLRGTNVDEMRLDFKVAWSPLKLKELELSTNWRRYEPTGENESTRELWWGNLGWKDRMGPLRALANIDIFNDNSQSLYGELLYLSGRKMNTAVRFRGGKTWGDLNPGHNSFRIGGNAGEGYFTQRPARLFPLRGFDRDILDAGQAATLSLDVTWPFLKLQTGYKSLPLFLHNVQMGTFADAGFAADHFSSDEILVSAGIELVTGMELAWDIMSRFSIGVAWPLKQPDDLNASGPVLLIQIGRPL